MKTLKKRLVPVVDTTIKRVKKKFARGQGLEGPRYPFNPPFAGVLKRRRRGSSSIPDEESKPPVTFSSPGTHHLMKRRRQAPTAESKKASAVEDVVSPPCRQKIAEAQMALACLSSKK
jgi:hypothetical protein